MVGWLVFLGILLLLVLLLLCPIRFIILYNEAFSADLKYLFFSYKFPNKKEGHNNEKKVKTKSDEKPKKSKNNKFLDILKGKGLSGFLRLLKQIIVIAKNTLKSFFAHLVIDDMKLNICVSNNDAAQTAFDYGKVCSIVYPALQILLDNTPKTKYSVFIYPEFTLNKSTVEFKLCAHIRLFYVIVCLIKALFKFIISFIKIRKV